MALIACPECTRNVSDRAIACPTCGYPMASSGKAGGWRGALGGVASTYISAQAVVSIVVGSVLFISFAAIMIALVLRH